MADEAYRRYDFIDSIRGIGALCVVFEHVLGILVKHMGPAQSDFADLVSTYFSFGKFGVDLFFIVSGSVVPFSLKGRPSEGLDNFIISRVCRLYPVYWLSVLAASWLIAYQLEPGAGLKDVFIDLTLVNLSMLQQFVGVQNLLPAYWTLQIELIFYVFCGFVFFTGQLQRTGLIFAYAVFFWASAFGIATAAFFQWGFSLPITIPCGLAMMCFGLLFRRGFFDQEAAAKFYAYWFLALFIVSIPCITFFAYGRETDWRGHWYIFTMSYLGALAAFILLTTRLKIRFGVFVWMGRVSYSAYLFNPIVIFLYKETLGDAFYRVPLAFHFAVIPLLVFGLSHFLFKYVEAPGIALGRKIILARRRRVDSMPEAFPHPHQ